MALNRELELGLDDAGLIEYFNGTRPDWLQLAQKMYDLVTALYPEGTVIRPDDVAEYVLPALKSDEDFRHKLAEEKLAQKYWYSRFTDLIIDRCWAEISADDGDGDE